ncbi:sensor histidine kinase [Hwanghaeella grinnelliae]|uniref:C4-dicarboxylate transport sensor protein DctB n=1 Tax=Hwanghaeella grinnelliae TaxID=2500179 RepID=A0A437QVI7_9PROT|nr:ATP-binding protein [Hwanghaeella grinnelliae]RVU38534.1 sensor histidine kinase [Hwanghaeella grinnelliae]
MASGLGRISAAGLFNGAARPVKATAALVLVLVCVTGAVMWQTAYWVRQVTLDEIGEQSRTTLNLIVENLRGDLGKYRYLPQVLAVNPLFPSVLTGDRGPGAIEAANLELERINAISGALDTYLMDDSGLTIAASNWAAEKPFIGKNFSYRPYFRSAMHGSLGRYFALGTTSGERGYYFAYPVRDGERVVGAVVVKLDIGRHERSWRSGENEILVVDDQGVIFLSSNPDWRFKALHPLSDEARQSVEGVRRYVGQDLSPLGFKKEGAAGGSGTPVSVTLPAGRGRKDKQDFLMQQVAMTEAGWNVLLLAKTDLVATQVRFGLAVAAICLASLALAATALHQRRRRVSERIAMQEEANAELELRVRDRTNKLTEANLELQREIGDRKRAEEEAQKAQAGLVQATKLAALGQLSAGLSHELNQPLAAIRSYADNAGEFLDRDQPETARKNLRGIAELTERMARIIRNLRTYARDEPLELRPTSLRQAIDESLTLLQARVDGEAAAVDVRMAEGDVLVVAGVVRLQQVFLNLLSNALDAMQGKAEKTIVIEIEGGARDVTVRIRDTGPGIPDDMVSNVFDPFFSTKQVGQGMGLGLSISFGLVNQFGGSIEAANAPEGGAVFTIRLRRAAQSVGAVA